MTLVDITEVNFQQKLNYCRMENFSNILCRPHLVFWYFIYLFVMRRSLCIYFAWKVLVMQPVRFGYICIGMLDANKQTKLRLFLYMSSLLSFNQSVLDFLCQLSV